ncbi:MAG: hypothetical protein WA094_05500 [Candidatus Desulfobacillus denitrificans]
MAIGWLTILKSALDRGHQECAEQNAQFVKRIEANRKRTFWLGAATLALAIVVFSALPF